LIEEIEPASSPLTTEREEINTKVEMKEPLACPSEGKLRIEKEQINTEVKSKELLACIGGGRLLYDSRFWQNTCDMLSDPTVIVKESQELKW